MAGKTIKVWTVLYDGDPNGPAGPAGDHTFLKRWAGKTAERDAKDFAATHTCYGRPASAIEEDTPRRVAERWGLA